MLYWAGLIYAPAMALVKVSVLLFYLRIFPNRWLRCATYLIAGMILAWTIAMELVLAFQCTPVHRAWNQGAAGRCLDMSAVYLGSAIPNVLTDLFIIVLPLPLISRLQMTRAQRFGLYVSFLMAGM